MDYLMSNSAIARSFTAYLASTIGVATDKWRLTVSTLPKGFNQIDMVTVVLVLIITLINCYRALASAVNTVLTKLHILFIAFVIVVGFWQGDWKNFTEAADPKHHPSGFLPYGISGVFNGAAMVYLSYIGYDAVSTMAKEVRDPVKDIQIGVLGSVILVTIFYCLVAASMSKLLPYDMAAVARCFCKTVDVYDQDIHVRTLRTLWFLSALNFMQNLSPANENSILAITEGCQLTIWDLRMKENGGCLHHICGSPGDFFYAVCSSSTVYMSLFPMLRVVSEQKAECYECSHLAQIENLIWLLNLGFRWAALSRWVHCSKYEAFCGQWKENTKAFSFRGDSNWLGFSKVLLLL
ncbi:Cationic amino acid transporter 7, chloroplastic [Morella rubra]|uniref:Cationic amino acid transporter 7, chloroplastic n=1 Tax=Morella rubra TaxID=262757 RepID=A0A6A1WC16_9ROSI|nr:Cationic amino acid transporter 7, chloroplastic [Morella rubra]